MLHSTTNSIMKNMKNHISDELIAAYLEGNTSPAETLQVLEAIKTDPILRETLNIALRIDNENGNIVELLPAMQMAAESDENLCGVMCEVYIMQKRGVGFDENRIIETARKKHWLKSQGTPLHFIGLLLANEGLMVMRKYDATLKDIEQALSFDNDVIVAVDSDKLYPDRPDDEDAANHAVVVTAVNEKEGLVTLYDPSQSSVLGFQWSTFENAWKESQHYMVRVLQTVDEYDPQPVNLDNIALTDDLLELQEAIAENAHDVWAAARIREGWSYGPVRDDQKKQHPDLIPYSALLDSEKEYDRLMALDTIKLVKKLGFEIEKR